MTECMLALLSAPPTIPQLRYYRAPVSPSFSTPPSHTTQVRKYGSTQSFWYDESVLLPALRQDLDKQVALQGGGFLMPRGSQGVPVTDGEDLGREGGMGAGGAA